MGGILLSTAPTYTVLNSGLITDLSNVIGAVGNWFTSNALLGMVLTISVVGLAISLIRSIRRAIC